MEEADNPQAFPVAAVGPSDGLFHIEGMSLRDYFAVHADQPGVSEIVAFAGGETDGFLVKFSAEGEKVKFNDWWNGLPLPERLELSARVRYGLADAMLAARISPTGAA